MSNIRKQSIISSVVIYIGFAIGLLNTYLFTKNGLFTESQYGLTGIIIAIATMMMAFANFAMPSFIYKFFPYYKDHLPDKKNDLASIALIVSFIGLILVIIAGIFFKGLVIRKYSQNSPELVTYYYWVFAMGTGFLLYTMLEAYAWQYHKSVLTNFLREVQWRIFTTLLIVLFWCKVINFDIFIKLYTFTYAAIGVILLLYLIYTKRLHFTFTISKVTRRFRKIIFKFCSFIYTGSLVFTISQVFDSIVIASVLPNALAKVGIYTLIQNVAGVMTAPQRGIVAATIPHLSRAWKEKNMQHLQRIYQRSSINQLIFSYGLYFLIIINFIDAVHVFNLKQTYLDGFYVFMLLGATKIIDMGTGVNSQIIATSTYWKFEIISGMVLLVLMLPLNYILTKRLDIIGPGLANLISITIYNLIRIIFLWKKFKLFPFTKETAYATLLAVACFLASYFLFKNLHGIAGLFARSIFFCLVYAAAIIHFRLSPDILPVWETIKKRIGIKA